MRYEHKYALLSLLIVGIICFAPYIFTWTNVQRLTWNPGSSSNTDIAADSTTNIFVVWQDGTPGNLEIFFKNSIDVGTTWATTQRLTWNSGDSKRPFILVDLSNTIHVIWHDTTPGNYEVYHKSSTNGGGNWSINQRLSWTPGYTSQPTMACDSSNNLHMVWYQDFSGNHEIIYKKSTDNGVSWSGQQRLTFIPGKSNAPEIAVDSSDRIHVVWFDDSSGNFSIYHKRSTDGGANWSGASRLTWNSIDNQFPMVCSSPDGNIHVVWFDTGISGKEIYYKRTTDGGTSWSMTRRLSWFPYAAWAPDIHADSNNTLHLIFKVWIGTNHEIHYKQSTDSGNNWAVSQRISWNSGHSDYPAIKTDAGNNVHVVWEDKTPGNWEVFYKKDPVPFI